MHSIHISTKLIASCPPGSMHTFLALFERTYPSPCQGSPPNKGVFLIPYGHLSHFSVKTENHFPGRFTTCRGRPYLQHLLLFQTQHW